MEYRSGNHRPIWVLLILCFLFYCLDYFYRISQSIIISPLMHQYRINALGIGAFASAFYLGYAICQLPFGYLLERLAFHRLFSLAVITCSLAYIAFLFSQHFWMGYILRCVIGSASALSFIGILYLGRCYLSSQWFSFIAGLAISLGTLSAALVQVIGVWIMQWLPWQLALTLFGVLGLIVGLLFLPNKVQKFPQSSPDLKTLAQQALRLFQISILWRNALIGSLFYLPTTIFASLWGVPFLITQAHFSPTQATSGIFFLFLGWALGSPIISWLAHYTNKDQYLISAFALIGFVISLVLLYVNIHSAVILFLLLLAFGLASSAQAIVWKIFDQHCPREINGIGVAWTNMLIMLSGILFHLAVGYLLEFHSSQSIHYDLGLSLIPIAFLGVAVTAFTLSAKNQ